MFAQKLNELTFMLELRPQGPLLIKASEAETAGVQPATDVLAQTPQAQFAYFQKRKAREAERREKLKQQTRDRRSSEHREQQTARRTGQPAALAAAGPEPAMQFVRTRRNRRNEPYLPGSSLKGALRSYAEQLARSMTIAGDTACNLFGQPDSSDPPCWHNLGDPDALNRQALPAWQVYPALCAACKLFGSPFLAGRLRISDAYLVEPAPDAPLPRRDGVGIDRQRGAAADGAKYDFEYWNGGAFQARVELENFELWQVGWLAHLIHALHTETLTLGFGSRRGLGRVHATVRELRVNYFGQLAIAQRGPTLNLMGVGQLATNDARFARYGFLPEASQPLTTGVRLLTPAPVVLRRTWAIEDPATLWQVVGPLWNAETLAQLTAARLALHPNG